MAPGNVDLIRPIYDDWGRGNWRPRFDVYHPHMEWGWSDDYPGIGDNVVVLASYYGRGKGSGVEIRQEGAHVFKVRDGKVVRLEIFANRRRALEAVGAVRPEKADPV